MVISDARSLVAQRTAQATCDGETLLFMVDQVMEMCGERRAQETADSTSFSVPNAVGSKTRGGEGFVPDPHFSAEL